MDATDSKVGNWAQQLIQLEIIHVCIVKRD